MTGNIRVYIETSNPDTKTVETFTLEQCSVAGDMIGPSDHISVEGRLVKHPKVLTYGE